MTELHELPAGTAPAPSRLAVPLLRPAEAAELLSVRPSWIYEAVRTNRLPCLRVGRHIRFTRAMLEAWLAEQHGSTG
jgi:excisionase family DNA binding protein